MAAGAADGTVESYYELQKQNFIDSGAVEVWCAFLYGKVSILYQYQCHYELVRASKPKREVKAD